MSIERRENSNSLRLYGGAGECKAIKVILRRWELLLKTAAGEDSFVKKMKLFIFFVCLGVATALPTLYNVDNNTNEGEAVMVPVASTVIPLEDLPVFKVGLGFGLGMKNQKPKKPANLKDIQLITAKNQHRFVAAAGVQELTKEEFDQFNI